MRVKTFEQPEWHRRRAAEHEAQIGAQNAAQLAEYQTFGQPELNAVEQSPANARHARAAACRSPTVKAHCGNAPLPGGGCFASASWIPA